MQEITELSQACESIPVDPVNCCNSSVPLFSAMPYGGTVILSRQLPAQDPFKNMTMYRQTPADLPHSNQYNHQNCGETQVPNVVITHQESQEITNKSTNSDTQKSENKNVNAVATQNLETAEKETKQENEQQTLQVPSLHIASQTDRCIDEEREAVMRRAGAGDGHLDLVARLAAEEQILIGDCHNRTSLIKRIGGGSFGDVFLGKLVETDQSVAVKVEAQNLVMQYVLNEGNIYRKLEGVPGIPRVYWYGLHGSEYAMMVMELMGSTLYEHWVRCGSKFTLKTTLMLIDQMLTTIQHMHENNIIHRDISVSNFMTGAGSKGQGQIHLIDFGHAKKLSNGQLVPAARRRIVLPKPMVGTPRFASVFCHMGQEEGYRDDLESLAYVWIYLYKGRLPWQGQRLRPGENKLERIAHIKLNTRLETLCEDLPEEFLVYLNYVRRLRPNQMPLHDQLRELFRNLAHNMNIEYDGKFDWIVSDKSGVQENGLDNSES